AEAAWTFILLCTGIAVIASRSEATASEAWHPELSPAPLIRGLWSIRRGGSAKSAESPRCIDHKRSLTARPRFGPRRPIPVSGGRQEGGGVEIFPTPPPLGTPGLRCRSRSGSVRQF